MAAVKSPTAHRPAKLTIALVGGGSGGHITPLLAVADELKRQQANVHLIYIGQKGDKLLDVPQQHHSVDETYCIRAGKFRRYHGTGFKQLLDIKTLIKNVRDFFYVLIGVLQAWRLLGRIKPDVIFIKGGFVGVPVGLMAALRGIPYVTHDSDAVPGLANRIIARWAAVHTVALPKSAYTYPANRTHSVGVPVNSSFRKVTKDVQAEYRRQLSLKPEYQVVFITGGGMGALRLNEAVVEAVSPLLKVNPKLFVIHASGRAHEGVTEQLYSQKLNGEELQRVMVRGFFIDDLYKHSGAADVIITRAGATNLAEFASQQKCCIIVPNPQLTGGHQSKNAQYLAENKAAIVLPDEDVVRHPKILADTLTRLLSSPSQRRTLANNLGSFAKPRAAKELAQILLETVA